MLLHIFPHREVFHFSFFSLQEPVELKIWLFLVEKNNLGIDIFPGRVIEIIQEVADADEGDVPADQNKLFVVRRLPSQDIYISMAPSHPPLPTLYCPPYLLPEPSRVASSGTIAAKPPTPTRE